MAYTREERERNKILLLATLNYLIEYHSRDMVFDDYSPSKQWYLQDLKQTEIDIEKSRSKQIKRRLEMHTSILRSRNDQVFNKYIKKNTNYEIDLFETFKTAVLPIIKKGRIDDNDVYLVEDFINAYAENIDEQEKIINLNNLQAKRESYLNDLLQDEDVITEKFNLIVQGKKSWTIAEEDYEEYLRESNKNWLLAEAIAPNGTNKLHLQFSGKGEQALTYINISLKGGFGSIYTAIGEKLPIKMYWKDDHNVVVETKSDYKFMNKYKQVSSYGDVVKIEYVEI
ncbi:MAG: hypothetical protein EOO91_12090 [Pedobacter sp.]|nr:MAG: hypothetical protein EOO91_12090 [Pedobacter sp.]